MKKIDYPSTLFIGIGIDSRINVISALNFQQEFLIKMVPPIAKTVNGLNSVEYQVFTSVLGIGKVYASGILAEIRKPQML